MKKGLTAQLELHLIAIAPGSAEVVLGPNAPQIEWPFDSLFSKTIVTLTQIVSDFGKTGKWDPPSGFPTDILKLFEPFGKSLRTNEWINLGSKDVPVRYDQKVRSRITSSGPRNVVVDVRYRGHLVEFDKESQTFQLRTAELKIDGKSSDATHAQLLKIFSHERRLMVEVSGLGLRTSREKVNKIERVDTVEIVHTQAMRDRVEKLFGLCPTWLEEMSKPKHDLIENFFRVWEEHVDVRLPQPNVFPIEDEGIELEWNFGPQHLSLEIAVFDLHGTMTHFNDETSDYSQERVNLFQMESWGKINQRAIEIMGRTAK